jgi:pimeloyl-ACP methyl ester carboxylesterase
LDYNGEQRNKPQTVALALSDSPIGVAAWIVEKLKAWSDSPALEPVFTKEQVVTNVMIYLVTNTIGTAAWFYRGLNEDFGAPDGRVTVPTGFASSPHEMTLLNPPRSALERNFNLVHYTKMSRGGHFAFWEQPEAMVADVRQFFRKLRI